MKDLRIINLTANSDAINTSDSYSQDVFMCGANLIIPYINLEVFEKIEDMNKQDRINFSYIILKGVKELQWIYAYKKQTMVGKIVNPEIESEHTDYFAIGGMIEDAGGELKIRFREVFLVVLPNSKVASNYWVPFNTPNFRRNLSKEQVNLFFDKLSVPEQVRTLTDCSEEELMKIVFSQNISTQGAQKIESDWGNF